MVYLTALERFGRNSAAQAFRNQRIVLSTILWNIWIIPLLDNKSKNLRMTNFRTWTLLGAVFKFQKNLYKTLITCATQCQDTKQIKIVVQTCTIKPSIHFFLLLNSIKNEIFTIVATMIISRDTNETIPQKRKKIKLIQIAKRWHNYGSNT